jgi:hypothetical protein
MRVDWRVLVALLVLTVWWLAHTFYAQWQRQPGPPRPLELIPAEQHEGKNDPVPDRR